MMEPKRSGLLKKYMDKPVTHYDQFDGFLNIPQGNAAPPDEDGDLIMGGETYELMRQNDGVRVLIPDSIGAEDAARVLSKIAGYVEDGLEDKRFRKRKRPSRFEYDDIADIEGGYINGTWPEDDVDLLGRGV